MKSGPNLVPLDSSGLLVLRRDDLGIVLDDVGETVAREHLLPQVVGLQPVRVRWIPRAVIPAPVEGEEPRRLAFQVGTEAHLVVVDREMYDAASELEQFLTRVAVALVLLDRVLDRLLGQAVLQLEGSDRQSVDEQAQVEGQLCVVVAVPELSCDAEPVLLIQDSRPLVAGRGRAVEEIEVVRPVPDTLAQHVYRATLGDLTLEASEEPASRWAVLIEAERLCGFGLGLTQERGKLREVHAVLAVVVGRVAAHPAYAVACRPLPHPLHLRRLTRGARQVCTDEALEASFTGVGGRIDCPAHMLSPRSVERTPSYVGPIQNFRDIVRVDPVIGEPLKRQYLRPLLRRQLRHVLPHKTFFHMVSPDGR